MRIVFSFLFIVVSGCADPSASEPSEPKVPDFHDYIDLNRFCSDAGAGDYALGYRSPMPWVDQVLCLSADGIREVNATENGATIEIKMVNGTGSEQGIMWIDDPSRDTHVSLADGLLNSCPDKQRPIAILSTDADTYPKGATIKHGARLCVVEGDLVDYYENLTVDPVMHRWSNFTRTSL